MSQYSHIVFIHGLANKPPVNALRRIWLSALGDRTAKDPGFNLGEANVRDSFVYWADMFYREPLSVKDYDTRNDKLAESVAYEMKLGTGEWMKALRAKFPQEEEAIFDDAPVDENTPGYDRIPIPWAVKKQVINHSLRETHDYLFNKDGIRDKIRERVVETLARITDDSPVVLVAHGHGSIIAYDVLTGVDNCPAVDGLVTMGSPLGLDEVQQQLDWSAIDGFPKKLRSDWVNVFDPFDVVARLDPKLSKDFQKDGEKVVIDVKEENWGKWRHSATKYLKGHQFRNHLRRLAGRP